MLIPAAVVVMNVENLDAVSEFDHRIVYILSDEQIMTGIEAEREAPLSGDAV
jgi:hypothetical protein